MAYPLPVPPDVEEVLTTAKSSELAMLIACIAEAVDQGAIPEDDGTGIVLILQYELQLRQVEPFWRKTKRFARQAASAFADWWQQNGEGATKVAAGVALAALFGISIHDQ